MRKLSIILIVVTLVGLLVGSSQAQTPQGTETERGATIPSLAQGPFGPARPLTNGGLLYLTSLDIGDDSFTVYDPATNTWTALNPYETGAQMAVSAAGQLYAFGYNTWTIDLYDPATDTWAAVMAAPPGAAGQYGNLEITNDGEFLYTEPWGNTLWYTAGGVWNTMALPFNCDAMGDYDPTADQYVIGEAWTTNAHWIDVHTWAITDYYSPVGNGEYARFSVVLDNQYFFEASGSPIHYFDLSNPALPPYDTGTVLGWYSSAAADRANHIIYVASLDGAELWAYDPVGNSATPLAGGTYGWHSSLAFAGPAGAPDTMHVGGIKGHFGWTMLKANVLVEDQGGNPLPGAGVTASLSAPNWGPRQATRLTNANGKARFAWGSFATGQWTLCVDDIVLAGYTYAPGDNVITCKDWWN